jgi:CubicO group peptidase (beta-lactamase class C family)
MTPRQIILLLAAASSLLRGAPQGEPLQGLVKSFLQEPDAARFNGVILVTHRTRPLVEIARGYADKQRKKRHTITSKFCIGSVSKQFAGVLALRLVNAGKLDMHASIDRYLPELKQPWRKRVTLHHLLNHTSGFVAKHKPLSSRPGETFRYNNAAYDLVGRIIERVSGKTYEQLAHELFASYGLVNTTPSQPGTVAQMQRQIPQLATAYVESENIVVPLIRTRAYDNPCGGLISTAYDLVQWNQLLHKGKVLPPHLYKQLVRPSSKRKTPWWGELGYGYGIQSHYEDGILEFSHGGWVPGYRTLLLYYPAYDISVVVLENIEWSTNGFFINDRIRNIVRDYLLERRRSRLKGRANKNSL